jgi:transcriptional antiterminator NusG
MESPTAMNSTEEQSGAAGEENSSADLGAPTPEAAPVEQEATPPAEPVEEAPVEDEPKKKRLSTGRGAAVHAKGATLKSLGVATTRMAVEAEKADLPTDETGEFDPASDLPMYRPGMDWFVLRVASNKESPVRETLLRKVQIEGMEDLVGRIMVPTEKTKTLKGGKQRITETKLYPGYVFVEMRLEPDGRIPQDVFFLIKETTGVGDFVGTAGRPTPMGPNEVEKMLFDSRRPEETPQVKMEFEPGDNVTIKEGPFENYEGTVDDIIPEKGLVRVLVTIFGRQAPVELEYWQIVKAEE